MQALVPFDFKVSAASVMITHEFHFHLAFLEDGNFILSHVYFGFKLTFYKDFLCQSTIVINKLANCKQQYYPAKLIVYLGEILD